MANWSWIITNNIQAETFKALWLDGLAYNLWPELEGKIVWESTDHQYVAVMYHGRTLYLNRTVLDDDIKTETKQHDHVSQEDWDAYFAEIFQDRQIRIIQSTHSGATKNDELHRMGYLCRRPVGDILREMYKDDWDTIGSTIDFDIIKNFFWKRIQRYTRYKSETFCIKNSPSDRYLPMAFKDENILFFDSTKILRMVSIDETDYYEYECSNTWLRRYKSIMGYLNYFAKVGDSFDDVLYKGLRAQTIVLHPEDLPRPVILKTFAPKFERAIDSTQPKSSFDWIKVEISLNSSLMSRKEMFSYINKHKAKFDKEALKSIEESTKWKKYDIPINVLKVTDLVFRNDFMLEYTFALKNAV